MTLGRIASGSTGSHTLRHNAPIATAADPAVVADRCGATKGDWCGRYYAQKPIPATSPPQGKKMCLWGAPATCNFVGMFPLLLQRLPAPYFARHLPLLCIHMYA